MNHIKLKIQELAKENTFNASSISYGYKFVGKTQTNELCIIFSVSKKKPITELLDSEIIPSSITLEDRVLKTDVFETDMPELLVCNGTCGQNAGANSIVNRTFTRPLVGGLSVTSTNLVTTVGTLGFIGVHINTQTLVGVTNNHVLIQDAFYTAERNLAGPIKNEYTPIDSVYQHGETGSIPPSNFIIGQTLRYVPIQQATPNKVDCSIFSINEADIGLGNISSSVMQAGVAYSNALPFATTTEIDNLLQTNPMLFSSGRTTGPKGGVTCPLRVFALFTAFPINYNKQYIPTQVYFEDQITFVKPEFDPSLTTICSNPIIPGDSGSALIADFGGVRKIVGLVFAASTVGGIIYYGYANRIDNVALEMGIQAWDGTDKNFVDLSSIEYVTTVGGSYDKYINCEQKKLWQVGLTTLFKPCTSPSPISYNCINEVCIDPGDGSGTYLTLVECETCCAPLPPVTSYNCTNGSCVPVVGPSGTYATLLACQAACIPPAPLTWDISFTCSNNPPNLPNPTVNNINVIGGVSPYCFGTQAFTTQAAALANTLWSPCADPVSAFYGLNNGTWWVALKDATGTIYTQSIIANCLPSVPTYNCFLGECTDPGDGSGVYPTLLACQAACIPITSWNCVDCECVSVSGSGGTYPTEIDCLESTCTDLFITTWQTTVATESIALPYLNSGTYSGTIDWGDGNTSDNTYGNRVHIYATAGTYTVTICGDVIGWNFTLVPNSRLNIRSVLQWGQLQLGLDGGNYFINCSNLDLSSVSDTLDLTGITILSGLFYGCTSLTSVNNINSWDTSAITTMAEMFYACNSFNQPLSFDTSAVTSMDGMFHSCQVFDSTLTFTSTSAVMNMSAMFYSCSSFNQPITFNTISVTNMQFMFGYCYTFNQALTFNTSAVTNMGQMFYACNSFQQNIGSWDISSVNNFSEFMLGKTPLTWPTTYFDNLMCGWSTQTVTPILIIDFGTANYTNATGGPCRTVLQSPPNNWNINSGPGV